MESITLTISAQTLNTIGAALQELPYKLANPAIQEIDKQVKMHLAQKESGNERTSGSKAGDSNGDSNGPDANYVKQD